MVRACPTESVHHQARRPLCRALRLRPSQSLPHPSNINLSSFSSLKTPSGLNQSRTASILLAGKERGDTLQNMMNGLLLHVPFNTYTVKGVEIVPALIQTLYGAEK